MVSEDLLPLVWQSTPAMSTIAKPGLTLFSVFQLLGDSDYDLRYFLFERAAKSGIHLVTEVFTKRSKFQICS
jgi:hypothetical protein